MQKSKFSNTIFGQLRSWLVIVIDPNMNFVGRWGYIFDLAVNIIRIQEVLRVSSFPNWISQQNSTRDVPIVEEEE